jgi:gliding motility-associated lipoprotein GldH
MSLKFFPKRYLGYGFFSLIIIVLVVSACDQGRVYEDYHDFNDRTWKVIEEPRFEFVVTDTTVPYNLYYNVRNSLTYPWARIFVTYHLYDSTGMELSKKLVFNDLFDHKTGKPFGESGLGDLYDHRFALLEHYRFPNAGKYSVKLDQMTRKDTLQGVIAVGIRVEKDNSVIR